MKTLFILILAAATATAQPFTEPARVIANQRVDLRPLFNWWTNVQAVTKQNQKLKRSARLPLPERPLTAWMRITTESITNNGFVTLAQARIQTSPLSNAVHQAIVPRHAPLNEKQRIEGAIAAQKNAADQARIARDAADFKRQMAASHGERAGLYNEMSNVDPRYRQNADAYGHASADASRQSAQASQRAENYSREQARLGAVTKGRSAFALDNFAANTGETYNGLPVYELGLPFGR